MTAQKKNNFVPCTVDVIWHHSPVAWYKKFRWIYSIFLLQQQNCKNIPPQF